MATFELLSNAPDPTTSTRYTYVVGTSIFVSDEPADSAWPSHFVGLLDQVALFAVDVPDGHDPSDGAAVDLRRFHGMTDEATWFAAGRSVQLVEWARTHRHCGRCGTPTVKSERFTSMDCPACGLSAFPRVAPAMITLVTRGDDGPGQEVLLARGTQWPLPMYSCLAGFVEAGESLESCVVREVREEVGIIVNDVRYCASQPWPFPHSLMIGFRARYESGDLVLDETEIADAQWYRRDSMPGLPGAISIARKLVDEWLAETHWLADS